MAIPPRCMEEALMLRDLAPIHAWGYQHGGWLILAKLPLFIRLTSQVEVTGSVGNGPIESFVESNNLSLYSS